MANVNNVNPAGLGGGRAFQSIKYPNPFFDVASTYLPPNVAALMKWCRYFGTVHPISGVLRKMAEYPITDLIWETESDELRNTYKSIVEDTLNIKSELVSMGAEYYTFGNSFITLVVPTNRFLSCPKCKTIEKISKVEYEFKKFEFHADCKKCKATVRMSIVDIPVKNAKRLRIKRWGPEVIQIINNELTGRNLYLYSMPKYYVTRLSKGDKFLLEDTPEIFLRAIRKKAPVEFNEARLFHFKRPSLAGKDMGWGEPLIQPVLKYLFYLQILMKHREAQAQQGISPLRILYPQGQGDFNVYENLNLQDWKTKVESEILHWRQDPNRIAVMPIPVGYEAVGGEHQALNTGPEVQQLMDDIIAGMQIPKSFYYGGAPYSGTSAEFRMLENHFISFQKQCLQFLNGFLLPTISKFLDIPLIKVRFSDLKVADDVQQKQLILNLNAQRPKKISDATLMAEFGLDPSKEKDIINKEQISDYEAGANELEAQARAQGRADIISIRAQVKGQLIAQIEQERLKKELIHEGYTEEEVMMSMQQQYAPGPSVMDQGQPAQMGAQPSEQEVMNLMNILQDMPAEQKDITIKKLERENPTLWQALMSQQAPQGSPDVNLGREANQVDMRPLPEQKPPTRDAPPM